MEGGMKNWRFSTNVEKLIVCRYILVAFVYQFRKWYKTWP